MNFSKLITETQRDEAIAMDRLRESGLLEHGLMMRDRLHTAGFTDDELCWYFPPILGPAKMKGAKLMGLPIFETVRGADPGIGLKLPVCSRDLDCKAHTEPPRQVDHLWIPWAKLHGVEGS